MINPDLSIDQLKVEAKEIQTIRAQLENNAHEFQDLATNAFAEQIVLFLVGNQKNFELLCLRETRNPRSKKKI